MKVLALYTHYVTPIFTKLNLLGLLHIAYNLRHGATIGVEPVGEYSYAVKILTADENGLKKDLIETLREQGVRLRNVINKAPYSYAQPKVLEKTIEMLNKGGISINQLVNSLLNLQSHDMRVQTSGSPSLVLAPDLGKFSSSRIPYEGKYPNLYDVRVGKEGLSLCTILSAIGFENCSFKMGQVDKRGEIIRYMCAFVVNRGNASISIARALYWIGRRFSSLSTNFERLSEQQSLSTTGLLALLSPIIKDAVQSTDTLSRLELNIYSLEREARRPWAYSRNMVVMNLENVALMPNSLAGALLAKVSNLRVLVEQIPEFFNLLGEYLLSRDDTLYVESLRTLASLLHERETKVPGWVKGVASFILEHGAR